MKINYKTRFLKHSTMEKKTKTNKAKNDGSNLINRKHRNE